MQGAVCPIRIKLSRLPNVPASNWVAERLPIVGRIH
jgi:hypothetical protein